MKLNLSETLRKEIENSEHTIYAIATGSGVDYAVIRRFMTKERDIKLSTASRIAEFLGIEFTKQNKKSKK